MRCFICLAVLLSALPIYADDPKNELPAKLKDLADKAVLPKDFDAADMVSRDVQARLKEANQRDYAEWQKIETKADWEKFRDPRIAALKKSLGTFPEPPKDIKVRVTKIIDGNGYKIENTLYESRPSLWVTANVYQPAKPGTNMPGILIVHGHHNPKEQGELQDMGVMWARAGCCVLVMDQLGHGERRLHPFNDAKSYPEPFKVGRQDYFFRYNLGLQLALIGESLAGWMAWDQMRGVDVLLKKPGVDPEKIILLGSVAAGGDTSAVAAALDPRIKCVVPFNFGGPQPETKKLGDNAEQAFDYAGGGSWESTRNLRDSARDGFLPWVIVASVAPRYLIHAHEFAWDQDHDPVWKRYQKIWGFYDAKDKLAFTHGRGAVTGQPPEASHCNNIGPVQRANIHAAFEKWFGVKTVESQDRHSAEELRCWTEEAKKELKPTPLGAEWEKFQTKLNAEPSPERAQSQWTKVLGVDPLAKAKSAVETAAEKIDDVRVISLDLNTERNIHVPARLLIPSGGNSAKHPVVIAFAQDGESKLLKDRASAIANLLKQGIAVCLADLRSMGETKSGSGRGRTTSATSVSSSEQMLGGTIIGEQLRDLSTVIDYLSKRNDIDGAKMAIWGESFAGVNGGASWNPSIPHEAAKTPAIGEPGAALLALLAELYHPQLKAVLARGGINGNASWNSPFMYIPHDSVVPGELLAGGEYGLYAAAPSAMRLEGSIDALDQPSSFTLDNNLREARKKSGASELEVAEKYSDDAAVAEWFGKRLMK